ncbi:NAD(+) diphosphatase [Rathayibacter sp. YIM 133350]|uniref:NAD(+) diphosphatase n=1 Tax=Rathayibacter sp. YIM 133350 TaxID=3131992 RepID=UPI00307CFC7B
MGFSVPLARHLLDRDADARTREGLVAGLLADPATRVLSLWKGRVLLTQKVEGRAPTLELVGTDAVDPEGLFVYLGRLHVGGGEVVPLLGTVIDDEAAQGIEPDAERWQPLRAAAAVLSDAEAALVVEAIAVFNWHDSHRHCPRCGAATQVRTGGWVRFCPVDKLEVFPRTDPAVIVLVTDADDRVLLGSNASWQGNRYSLLAGFVEPGESLEHAVIRELKEETGLDVVEPAYRGSQPWPFPASIMLGFTAALAPHQKPEDIAPDGQEILELRWFSREDLRAAHDDVVLPGAASIARALLEEWFGGPLGDEERW